jgi:hypothetical protein
MLAPDHDEARKLRVGFSALDARPLLSMAVR